MESGAGAVALTAGGAVADSAVAAALRAAAATPPARTLREDGVDPVVALAGDPLSGADAGTTGGVATTTATLAVVAAGAAMTELGETLSSGTALAWLLAPPARALSANAPPITPTERSTERPTILIVRRPAADGARRVVASAVSVSPNATACASAVAFGRGDAETPTESGYLKAFRLVDRVRM